MSRVIIALPYTTDFVDSLTIQAIYDLPAWPIERQDVSDQ